MIIKSPGSCKVVVQRKPLSLLRKSYSAIQARPLECTVIRMQDMVTLFLLPLQMLNFDHSPDTIQSTHVPGPPLSRGLKENASP